VVAVERKEPTQQVFPVDQAEAEHSKVDQAALEQQTKVMLVEIIIANLVALVVVAVVLEEQEELEETVLLVLAEMESHHQLLDHL
jgi:ribosomal protein L11 methylase PrmA